jgi:hypothetical protein
VVQDVRRILPVREIADLIDDQHVRRDVAHEGVGELVVMRSDREILDEFGGGDEERVEAFCIAFCLPEVELRSMSLNWPRSVRRASKAGRARPADLCGDPSDVRCCAASDFHNGETMAAAAAPARTVKISILRIICASFGFG